MDSYYNILETLVCITAVSDGRVQVLLKKKKSDPYKGYWILPGKILPVNESLEESARGVIMDTINMPPMFLMQGKTFSDVTRDPEARIIACTFTTITSLSLARFKNDDHEYAWFDVDKLPKLGYDHLLVIRSNVKKLNHKILKNEDDVLFKFFPSDFTLTEFQCFFEGALEKKIDRRNFRKRLLSREIVLSTGIKSSGSNGRPAELYELNKSLGEGSILE